MAPRNEIMQAIRSIKNQICNRCRDLGSVCVTLVVRTHVRRWRKVAHAGRPPWDDRNQTIANLIPRGSSVLDVGCGSQSLKNHLKGACKYQPCDLIKSTPDVIVCDFNAGFFPD